MDPIETYARRVRRFRGGEWTGEDFAFPLEVPVAVYVNANLLATLSATPEHLPELAAGFLFTEKLITSIEEVKEISARADAHRGQVWVDLTGDWKDPGNAQFTSGCGRGITFLCASDLSLFSPVETNRRFSPADLRNTVRSMKDRGETGTQGRGVHTAVCLGPDGVPAVAEDIGRHNAVDKALGLRLRSRGTVSDAALFSTGRISSEMALKAVVAQCPLVASLSGATHLAAEVCEELGVTLVTYVRGEGMVVCTHPERVEENGSAGKVQSPPEGGSDPNSAGEKK
ncbi:MAG: formate dehydrogenase accessory sulfurtransferase FdhD [Planctomycetota bacterium]|jgi:FdhD protein